MRRIYEYTALKDNRKLTADRLEFLNLIIDHLTARGVMDPKLLYETPFTGFDTKGVEGVFEHSDVVRLVQILRDIEPKFAVDTNFCSAPLRSVQAGW